MKKICFLLTLTLLYISFASGADLRGSLRGLSDASLNVSCGDFQRRINISASGGFHISDLPVNKSCYFTVSSGQAVSVRIAFNTKQNVTDYRGLLRKVAKKVIVIRK